MFFTDGYKQIPNSHSFVCEINFNNKKNACASYKVPEKLGDLSFVSFSKFSQHALYDPNLLPKISAFSSVNSPESEFCLRVFSTNKKDHETFGIKKNEFFEKLIAQSEVELGQLRNIGAEFRSDVSFSLSINNYIDNTSLKDIIKRFPNITQIHVRSCNSLSDACLTFIGTMPHLQTLDLAKCEKITGLGLMSIQALPQLQELTISKEGITETDLAPFAARGIVVNYK